MSNIILTYTLYLILSLGFSIEVATAWERALTSLGGSAGAGGGFLR